MTLTDFLQLLRRNWLLFLAVPLVTAGSIFFFTRKEVQEYASATTVYTGIASGFNIDKNSTGGDYANNKAYGNLLSVINARDTKREVALRLLARYLMLKSYDSTVLNPETYNRLGALIPEPVRHNLLGSTVEETTSKLDAYQNTDGQNVIYKILNSDIPSYSLAALDKITAYQVGNSDLVKIEYVSDDAAVCQQTLADLTQVFMRKHRELQEGQNESVINYFGSATTKARQRLDDAEKSLLAFQRVNNLINYDEQAATIAAQKDAFEQQANELELQYAGAASALKTLERGLKSQGISNLTSQETYHLSNQLIKLRTQLANAEVFTKGKKDVYNAASIQKLKDQAEQVEHQLQESINKYTAPNQPIQGVSNKSLASDWIRTSVQVEELKAKLMLMRKQRDNFGKEYQKVAPLGAEMRKIARERELAEKEYIALLNNLDQSHVTQQSIELSSHLKVVDPPYLIPSRAKSKRLLLILFGALSALMVAVGAGVATVLFDQSLKTPASASAKTSLPVFGVLPQAQSGMEQQLQLLGRAEEQLTRQLLLKMQQKQNVQEAPYVIGVVSSRVGEGKSTIASSMTSHLNAIGVKTLLLLPGGHAKPTATDALTSFYSPLQGLNPKVMLMDVVGARLFSFTVVIIEFPALLEAAYPVAILQQLDLILVAVRANRGWQTADKIVFENIAKATKAFIELVLNGVEPSCAQEYLGTSAVTAQEEQLVPAPPQELQWPRQAALQS